MQSPRRGLAGLPAKHYHAYGAAFATYGTDPAIEVLVPSAYAPEPMLLTDFTTVAKSLPRTERRCIG